jgi:hypothetical protein
MTPKTTSAVSCRARAKRASQKTVISTGVRACPELVEGDLAFLLVRKGEESDSPSTAYSDPAIVTDSLQDSTAESAAGAAPTPGVVLCYQALWQAAGSP